MTARISSATASAPVAAFKQNIKDAIEKLPDGDVKKLKGYTNAFRLRVGDYRILFDMNGLIEVTDVLPRGQAYK